MIEDFFIIGFKRSFVSESTYTYSHTSVKEDRDKSMAFELYNKKSTKKSWDFIVFAIG